MVQSDLACRCRLHWLYTTCKHKSKFLSCSVSIPSFDLYSILCVITHQWSYRYSSTSVETKYVNHLKYMYVDFSLYPFLVYGLCRETFKMKTDLSNPKFRFYLVDVCKCILVYDIRCPVCMRLALDNGVAFVTWLVTKQA